MAFTASAPLSHDYPLRACITETSSGRWAALDHDTRSRWCGNRDDGIRPTGCLLHPPGSRPSHRSSPASRCPIRPPHRIRWALDVPAGSGVRLRRHPRQRDWLVGGRPSAPRRRPRSAGLRGSTWTCPGIVSRLTRESHDTGDLCNGCSPKDALTGGQALLAQPTWHAQRLRNDEAVRDRLDLCPAYWMRGSGGREPNQQPQPHCADLRPPNRRPAR